MTETTTATPTTDPARVAKLKADPKTAEVVTRWRDHARRHRRRIKLEHELMYPAGVVVAEMRHLLAECSYLGVEDAETAAIAERLAEFVAYNRADVRKNSFVPLPAAETSNDFLYLIEKLEEATGGPLAVGHDDEDDDEAADRERPASSAAVVTMNQRSGRTAPAADDDDV